MYPETCIISTGTGIYTCVCVYTCYRYLECENKVRIYFSYELLSYQLPQIWNKHSVMPMLYEEVHMQSLVGEVLINILRTCMF